MTSSAESQARLLARCSAEHRALQDRGDAGKLVAEGVALGMALIERPATNDGLPYLDKLAAEIESEKTKVKRRMLDDPQSPIFQGLTRVAHMVSVEHARLAQPRRSYGAAMLIVFLVLVVIAIVELRP
jgi:hypothetical protein